MVFKLKTLVQSQYLLQKNYILISFVIVFLSSACSENAKRYRPVSFFSSKVRAVSHKNKIKYSLGFSLEEVKSNYYIVVYDPWHAGDTLATYLLIRNEITMKNFNRRVDFKVQIPVQNVASLSLTYLGMFDLLGETDRVIATTEAKYIYNPILYQRFLDGKLVSLGESMQINGEAVIGLFPALVMKYLYGGKETVDEQITDAGIPIAYNLEYLETHPLGRAEWIKFAGAFVDKYQKADSIFKGIEKSYLDLCESIKNTTNRPTVLDGSNYQGIWHAAGGRSYPAQLYRDAGADYYWNIDSSRGNIPLSFEIIIDKQVNADYWIGPSSGSKAELLSIDGKYSLLRAFREDRVYRFDKRINPNGGLDYFESGVVNPDILLKDLIWVFHGEVLDPYYKPVYLEKIR
jgi:iron complex transport system substrate-binding protein